MGERENSTAVMSVTDTQHNNDTEDCLEKDLPDLYPVNCHPKTCFATGISSKDLGESSGRTNDGNHSDTTQGSVSLSQSLACFIPFLWNSLWTGIYLPQSILLTFFMQTFFNTDTWADAKLFRSVMSIEAGGASIVSSSWPPPALLLFALLTLAVLISHPDGFTWIALGKLR